MNCSRSSGLETPASIGEKYLRTLDALTAIDPVLGGWTIWEDDCTLNELEAWAGAGSPEPAPIRPVLIEDARRNMTALVEANVQLNDWGEPQPDEGYHLVANNKDNLTPRNVGISVTAGAELSRNNWSVSTGMMGQEPPVDPSLITYPILGGAFRVMTSMWPTPWAKLCGSTTEYERRPSSLGFGFENATTFRHEITWMGYLSAERAAGFEPPSELISERGADGGLLMIAVEERPDPDNPDHMSRSDLLSSIMQKFYVDPFPRRRPAQT